MKPNARHKAIHLKIEITHTIRSLSVMFQWNSDVSFSKLVFFSLFRQFFHGKKAFVWLITLTTNTRDHCWLHLDNINFPFDTFKPHLFVSKRQRIEKKNEEKNRSCDESGRCDNVVFMNKNSANSSCVGQEENNMKRWSKNIKKIVISCFFILRCFFLYGNSLECLWICRNGQR